MSRRRRRLLTPPAYFPGVLGPLGACFGSTGKFPIIPSGRALASIRLYAGRASAFTFQAATFGNWAASTMLSVVATLRREHQSAAENSAPPNQGWEIRGHNTYSHPYFPAFTATPMTSKCAPPSRLPAPTKARAGMGPLK